MSQNLREDKATVVSIFPFDLLEEKPGLFPGRFTIPKANGTPTLVTVGPSVHYVYVGEDRPQIDIVTSAIRVAESIAKDFLASQPETGPEAHPGVWYLGGEVTLPELSSKHQSLLDSLQAKQKNWYLNLIRLGDDDWTKYHKHTCISEIQRHAARELGYEREWIINPNTLPSMTCPACTTRVTTATVVCPRCRCILDEKKFAGFKFAQ